MTTARIVQTATLLNNGTVLVAGGGQGSGILSSAELFDPTTGTFSATGTMSANRNESTATLLTNGKVLVAGGFHVDPTGFQSMLASAELYDPTMGTFSPTGSMSTARVQFTATLLKTGKVLVVGGNGIIVGSHGSSGNLATAELYDPATGSFSATGSMSTARSGHTATLLNDGEVLVAGGGNYVATAELYDPTTGTFSAASNMVSGRFLQTATLLDTGKVLVAGGLSSGTTALASTELYDVPAVGLSATTLDYGNETIGISSVAQTVTLTNNLPTAVTASIAVSGPNANDFAQTNTCSTILGPGTTCSISVTFTPAAVGNRSASVTITDNAQGSPQVVTLAGMGIAPAPIVSLSSPTLTFPNQAVGTVSGSQLLKVTNTGHAALTIAGVAVVGINSSDFSQTNTCGSPVPVGVTCTVTVSFKPTAAGPRSASLSISDNATDSPQTVSLAGTGVGPAVTLSATSISFGGVPVGGSTAAQVLLVTNSGNSMVTITTITVGGTNPSDFTQTNNCSPGSGGLAPGTQCSISVSLAPSAAGARSALIVITDNAPDSPQTVSLAGTGLAPLVSLSPASITFPNQYVGTTGLPQTVTLTNMGTMPLNVATITAAPADFGQLSACGNTLAAGSSCAIGVFFDPTASGSRTGTLTINDNATGSPQTVALSGMGQDFTLTPQSTSVTIAAGQTATYSVSVSPGGGFNQSVSFTCIGAPSLSTCNVSPASVPLNGSTPSSVTVTVATTASAILFPDTAYPRPPYLDYRIFVLALLFFSGAVRYVSQIRYGKRFLAGVSVLVFTLYIGISLLGCGGGGSAAMPPKNGTPAGTYSITVAATINSGSTNLAHNTTLTLIVR
jgi:hypothetical protein